MKRLKTVLSEIPNVQNMVSSNGNDIPNQFEIFTNEGKFFKSYNTIIAAKLKDGRILLDADKWDYSKTTSKYRNDFLRLDTKETKQRIKDGSIILADLNQ